MSKQSDRQSWRDAFGPHVGAAIEYCEDVVAGRQIAGHLIRLACQRFLDDLYTSEKDTPYTFDPEEATRKCVRIESLPHIEGEWAARREMLHLEPWQCFVVCSIFGWRHRETGLRRYRTVYIEVARKNAKSTLAAGIAICLLEDDGEQGAKIYSAATKRDQAKIVFGTSQEMVRRAKAMGLEWASKIDVRSHAMLIHETASKFEPLHSEGTTLDGLNIHAAINDELHAWKRRDLYEVIETATGARAQPIIVNITTAGHNIGGICYELRGYGIKVLEKTLTDDTFLFICYTLDKGDDPWDEANWPKANPNYGVSVYPDDMRRLARKAKEIQSQQTGFLTKRLNIWCKSDESWMDMETWNACADPALNIREFRGQECVAAFDVAEKRDITAVAKLFPRQDDDGRLHVYAFLRYYIPEEAAKGKNDLYDGWARSKRLVLTEGNIIDLRRIEEDMVEDSKEYQIEEAVYDPHNALSLSQALDENGMTVVEFRQTPMNFDEPMRWLEALTADGRFHHDGDPVLTWMVSNVTVRKTGRMHEFLHPRKERDEEKIDGVVAICMALSRIMAREGGSSVYEERGVLVL